ncbi:MAG: LysR family transcriptional regulator [Silicimonas sp.]|nr:LysR family transcriptional regulator [Silicimonas sp.]
MIKSRFTLKQLEAFTFVVDLGSFRAAAQALGTTQPNVSARIAALEDTLDCSLMQRDAGAVRLSEAGVRLLPMARATLRAAEQFLEVADRRDLIAERLRLGVTELVASTWLHDFLRAFNARYPSVSVELEVDLSREITRRLTDRQLDLALQTGPFKEEISGHLALGRFPYIWAACPARLRALAGRMSLADLFDHPILTHARTSAATLALIEEARKQNLSRAAISTISSLVACKSMALDDMGIALLPCHVLREELATGQLIELPCTWHPEALELAARYDRDRAPGFLDRAARLAEEVAEMNHKN